MKRLVLALALGLAVPSIALASGTSAYRYGASEALSVQDARLGEILMVREVRLESDKRVNAGSAIGGAVGYGLSRQVKGDQRRAAQVAGTVIGGVAGTAVHNAMTGKRGLEIYVRDFSDKRGRVLVVVQEADVVMRQGDRVFLVGKGQKTRVVPIFVGDQVPMSHGRIQPVPSVGPQSHVPMTFGDAVGMGGVSVGTNAAPVGGSAR